MPNGATDTSWGSRSYFNPGFAVVPFGVAVQTDGKIVVVGAAEAEPRHFMVARITKSGDLDPTFDGDGWLTTDFHNGEDTAHDVCIQPDGKIVVGGQAELDGFFGFAAARYHPNGALDPSFGGDGKVFFGMNDHSIGLAIALHENGKLVMAGQCNAPFTGFALAYAVAQLNIDGTLDNTFSGDGRVIDPLGEDAFALAVATQPDGKVVVGGSRDQGGGFVIRYAANGARDGSFSGDGLVPLLGNSVRDLKIQPDGKIVAFGTHERPNGELRIVFERLLADGQLDTPFGGGDGNAAPDFGSDAAGTDLHLLADGRMLGTGAIVGHIVLARVWPDGTLDAGGQQAMGLATSTMPPGSDEYVYGMAMQPDGRLVVAGTVWNAAGTQSDLVLARFFPNGDLDHTFGDNGRAIHGLTPNDVIRGLAIQPDGKIVLGGYTGATTNPMFPNFWVVRFNADGTVDTSFGFFGAGNVFDFGSMDFGHALAIAPDGKIVIAGSVFNGQNFVFGVGRFTADGFEDTTFDGDGKRTFSFSAGAAHWASAVLVQPDRKIVVGGQVNGNFALVRFLENGAVDQGFGGTPTGVSVTDMGGTDAVRALALETTGANAGRIYAAGIGGAANNFAIAQYRPNGVLWSGAGGWSDGKAFRDFGGYDNAWAIDVRGDRVVTAGCTEGALAWAQYGVGSNTLVVDGSIDMLGVCECEQGGEVNTLGGVGARFLFLDKVVVAVTQNIDGDRNFALAAWETHGTIPSVPSDNAPEEEIEAARGVRLQPAYPNPSTGRSVIAFDLSHPRSVCLRVFDAAGRVVRTLTEGQFTPGRHETTWDANDDHGRPVAAGVYYTRLDAGTIHRQRSVVVIR